ncbi:hypothetical protein NB646_07685 [Oxalobacter aliiformigenes]|uniref:Uncharacterized protein n=1 Tax=Oxalobacter aliiformigenes TaxID=2946593 RepID=A0A9E9LDG7_9BURK|nr:hypothetical protein [Oxalobacter aliiformigenes]WAV90724.1 hypothetical protein NB646_07685 [Oxalobacter aliiformigenes]
MAVLWQLFGSKTNVLPGLVFHLGREKEKQERLGDEGVFCRDRMLVCMQMQK